MCERMKIYENAYARVRATHSYARVRREQKDVTDVTDGLEYLCVKNAHESAQLIVTAKSDLTFSARANDLQDGFGNVLKKSAFEIFYEKYLRITRNWHKNGFPIGEWPDALIPLDAPVNTIFLPVIILSTDIVSFLNSPPRIFNSPVCGI